MSFNINAGYGQLQAAALTPVTTGKTFLVCPTTIPNYDNLSDMFTPDSDGTTRLYSTIASALTQCVASRGDVIYVAPWYTETLTSATSLGISKAWVSIIGLGTGSLRPTITFGTAATTTIAVSADNVTLKNILFVANFADITSAFTLTTAAEFEVSNCEFRDTSSILNFVAIITTTVSVDSNGLKFNGNRLALLGTTAATTPIKVANTLNRIMINDNYVTKAVLNNTSCLLAHGALVVTNLEMNNNKVFSANTDSATGAFLITTSSTTNTGMVCNNYVQGLDVAGALLVTAGSKYGMFNNLYDWDADASGFVLPAIGTN